MSRAAVSMFVFGVYLLVLGPTLVVALAFLTGLFGLGSPQEVWIRVLGAIVTILGFYYVFEARRETKDFFWATVWGRPFVIVFFAAFVLLGLAEPVLILFGVVDLLGAGWTFAALRAER
ncbi:MAG: hypothetical protein WBB42_03725 [Polyangiales bacterium]